MASKIGRCSGCGVEMQTQRQDAPGYTPEAAMARERPICQRCYRIRHYNDALKVALQPQAYLDILHHIGLTRSLVLHIVDLFDLEGSWIDGLHRFVGANPVWLVVNKVDLLPASISLARLKHRLQQRANEQGVRPEEIFLVSAKRGTGLEELLNLVRQRRQGRDVYVVGATNVGKSSLINRLSALIGGSQAGDPPLTISPFPGTTLDTVKLPLPEGGELVDTPGVVHGHRLTEFLLPDDLRAVVPDKGLHPSIYQLSPGQTLFLGGLARVDFVRGKRASFVCYVADRVRIHRTKTDRADAIYREHLGHLLIPPSPSTASSLPPWRRTTFFIDRPQDVSISGLGWVAVKGADLTLDVLTSQGVRVISRDCLI